MTSSYSDRARGPQLFEAHRDYLRDNSSTAVTFCSFMAATSTFFVSILMGYLGDGTGIGLSLKVPVTLLIISMVEFLFSAILYMESMGSLTWSNSARYVRLSETAAVLSEYFGVFPLVASIPLAINAFLMDPFLRGVAFLACFSALALYELRGLSVTHTFLGKKSLPFSIGFLASLVALSASQLWYPSLLLPIALIVIAYCVIVAVIAVQGDLIDDVD